MLEVIRKCSFWTLPQHDLFFRGPWERRKPWNLLLAHLTLISTPSFCSTHSSLIVHL